MVDFIEFDGYDFKETDGAQVMLTKLYNEMFSERVLRKGYPSFSVKALG